MQPIELAVNEPFVAPPAGANWVVFSDSQSTPDGEAAPRMLARAARYARKYGVYLIPERFIQNRSLCLCLISPEGKPLLAQAAVHMNLGRRGELARSDSLAWADTPFGRVALCVDVDVHYPAYFRAAASRGVRAVFNSRFIEIFDALEGRVRTPVVSAALTAGVYVVSVTNVGSCIAAPGGRVVLPLHDTLSVTATLPLAEVQADARRAAAGQRLIDGYFGAGGRAADA